jgi:hypothetical protein
MGQRDRQPADSRRGTGPWTPTATIQTEGRASALLRGRYPCSIKTKAEGSASGNAISLSVPPFPTLGTMRQSQVGCKDRAGRLSLHQKFRPRM